MGRILALVKTNVCSLQCAGSLPVSALSAWVNSVSLSLGSLVCIKIKTTSISILVNYCNA